MRPRSEASPSPTAVTTSRNPQNWRTARPQPLPRRLARRQLNTLLLILVFGFTLIAPRLGWGGKKIAWTSIAGFVLLVFSYSVVNLFITAEHVFR